MNYQNPIRRFLLRKNLLRRVKMRLANELRKLTKNEFDDMGYLYSILGEEPSQILDCGANIGFVSYQLSKRFPTAQIHAFEPNPMVFEKMNRQLHTNKKILTQNLGIAKEPGFLEFNNNKNSGTSSFRTPNAFHKRHYARSFDSIRVPVTSIDSYCRDAQIEQIGILKLDIEGFELEALQGANELIGAEKIDFIFSEVNLVPSYNLQPCIEDIVGYCRRHKYLPYNFYGINESRYRQGILTNILFVSNSVATRLNKRLGPDAVFTI